MEVAAGLTRVGDSPVAVLGVVPQGCGHKMKLFKTRASAARLPGGALEEVAVAA
jgi:hypothetical protein